MSRIHAWCECGHHEVWHFEGGPCAHRYDDHHVSAGVDCTCSVLRLTDIELPVGDQ